MGLSIMGLSMRVVYGKQVLIKHLRGTHVIVYGGGQKTTQRVNRRPKSGRQTCTRRDMKGEDGWGKTTKRLSVCC